MRNHDIYLRVLVPKIDEIRFLLCLFIQIHTEDIHEPFALLIHNRVEERELKMSVTFIGLQLTLEKLYLRIEQMMSSDLFIILVININEFLISDEQMVISRRKVYIINGLLGDPVL